MKVTLTWLQQYVDFSWSPEELAERLTLLGLEVEGVQKLAGEFEGVVVAQVLTKDKHPNADKLTLCRVNDGRGERQIVCGATNFEPGDKVPLILPGATLPARPGELPLTIKVGRIRGVESHGMMCSPRELGLGGEAQGLLILPPDARVGQSFAEHLGRPAGDVVYDLEVTPNRPDLNSVIGIAREISALTGQPLRLPEVSLPEPTAGGEGLGPVERCVRVRIEDSELCPRYVARVLRGVQVGPSPDWLRAQLEKVGQRSINNVVDVTNYVMLETGQPLHAFDYRLLKPDPADPEAPPSILVRRAQNGELFTPIDGQKRTLLDPMLVIADATRAVALAGIMGGQDTEIGVQTTDVLLESACFKPQSIRRTSRVFELRTESSYRFERGADVGICEYASRRAARLILQTAGGQLAEGCIDAWPHPAPPVRITLRHEKVGQLLGVEIPPIEQVTFLTRLGLEVMFEGPAPSPAPPRPASVTVRIPTFRVDLKREADLIEEIGRLFGVEKIPATPPRGARGSHPFDAVHDALAEARQLLTGLGLHEAQGQTLLSESAAQLAVPEPVRLQNALSSDMNVLRPSLLPGLLEALRHNLSHKQNDVALFEIGRVFLKSEAAAPREERRVALALTGLRHPPFWSGENRDARWDRHDLKGLIEEFLEHFGVRGVSYNRRPDRTELFLESAIIQLGKHPLGELGQLLPPLVRRYDLRDAVFLAELNLDLLLARRQTSRSFKPLSAFPAIRRDVAMLVPEAVTHEAVLQAVRQARAPYLEQIELFDIFRGRAVPEGQKSLAYAFTYRHPERTLTDAEVGATHEALVAQLKQRLGAVVREG